MTKKFNVSTPSGFPEFSPKEERIRQFWIKTIAETFEKYGFQPITTPLVEREENLIGKGGNPKEIYALKRILDEDGDKSHSGNTLRFDHTVPLALYVARHRNELTFPFKRYAIGPVFRGERAQKGRFRQFDQCDIDIIGMENLSIANDALMPAIIIEIFQKLLPNNDFVVRINNRKILKGFALNFGIPEDEIKAFLDILDDLHKVGEDEVKKRFIDAGFNKELCTKGMGFFKFTELSEIQSFCDNEVFQEGIKELETVIQTIEEMGVSDKNYTIDLTIARGLDYYTGTVYETNLIENIELGSICSGGRYEDLASVFTGKTMPGVGISIGLTRLLSQLIEANVVQLKNDSHLDFLFIPADEIATPRCMKLAQQLRTTGTKVDVYLEKKKLGKKFDYADKIGVRYVGVIGENELKDRVVQIKNMETGEKEDVKESEVVNFLKS